MNDSRLKDSRFPLESLAFNMRNGGRRLPVGPLDRVTILDIQGSDDKATGTVITLELALRNVPNPNPPIIAQVDWGAGGLRMQALLDFVNGTTFTVFASSIRVIAINPNPLNEERDVNVMAGAFIGYLPFGGRQAQLSVQVASVGGVFPDTVIPAFARKVTVVAPTALVATDTLDFDDFAGTLRARNFLDTPRDIPIPNSARTAALAIASGPATATLIYELAL